MDITSIVSNIPLWTVVVTAFVAMLYIYQCCQFNTWKRLGVPGPPPRPFLGNIFKILKDGKSIAENGTSPLTKRYGKIFGVYLFNVPILYVSDMEVLKTILVRDFHKFTDRHRMGDGGLLQKSITNSLLLHEGLNWKRARKIITPIFAISKLKLLTGYTNIMARKMSQTLEECADKNIMLKTTEIFRAFTLDTIMGTFYGLDMGAQSSLNSHMAKLVDKMFTSKPLVPLALFLRNIVPLSWCFLQKLNISFLDNDSLDYFMRLIRKCIEERKSNLQGFKRSDLIQLLLQAEIEAGSNPDGLKGNKLTPEEVEGEALIFLLGGFESTALTLHFLTYSIAKNKDIQEKLVKEIERVVGHAEEISYEMCRDLRYMEAVINETLRMFPPFVLINRQAVMATSIKGIPVAPGMAIYANLIQIGRDPDIYQHPHTFNPDRFFNKQNDDNEDCGKDDEMPPTNSVKNPWSTQCLAFGIGPRKCVGAKLAMVTVKIALVHALRKVNFLNPIPNELMMSFGYLTIDTKEKVLLQVTKRQNYNQIAPQTSDSPNGSCEK